MCVCVCVHFTEIVSTVYRDCEYSLQTEIVCTVYRNCVYSLQRFIKCCMYILMYCISQFSLCIINVKTYVQAKHFTSFSTITTYMYLKIIKIHKNLLYSKDQAIYLHCANFINSCMQTFVRSCTYKEG